MITNMKTNERMAALVLLAAFLGLPPLAVAEGPHSYPDIGEVVRMDSRLDKLIPKLPSVDSKAEGSVLGSFAGVGITAELPAGLLRKQLDQQKMTVLEMKKLNRKTDGFARVK